MSAPEEENIAGSRWIDDLFQTAAAATHHDVGNVSNLQIAELVVHFGTFANILVYELVIGCGRVVAALHENLSREDIATVVGQIILDDEYDMVVVIAVLAQQLVHGEGIGLVAVVAPCGRGADDHCPAVGDCGKVVLDGHFLIFRYPHLVKFPEGRRRSLRIAALRADVQDRFGHTAACILNAPEDIVGTQHLGITLLVEVQTARGTRQADVATGGNLAEGTCQSLRFPATAQSSFRCHDAAYMVGQRGSVGLIIVLHRAASHRAVLTLHTLVGST